MATKNLNILYFALLRDQRGLSEEAIQSDALDAKALYKRLQEEHGFTLTTCQLRVAINEAFADWDTTLSEGDQVVFIPPVAGG
jgi:sulfur-carrier protein